MSSQTRIDVDAWYNRMGNGYFYDPKFAGEVQDWEYKSRELGLSNKLLPDIISDLENICGNQPFYPSASDPIKVAAYLKDQRYGEADRALFISFYQSYISESADTSVIEDGRRPPVTNAALAKWKDVPDWEISFQCAKESAIKVATLGYAGNWGDDSPCRVPPIEGKTALDAFTEGVAGGTGKIVKGATDLASDTFKKVWEASPVTVLIVIAIAIGGVYLVTASKKGAA